MMICIEYKWKETLTVAEVLNIEFDVNIENEIITSSIEDFGYYVTSNKNTFSLYYDMYSDVENFRLSKIGLDLLKDIIKNTRPIIREYKLSKLIT